MGGLHPKLRWLDDRLPAPGAQCLVLTTSAMAAAALRRGVTAQRGALLGVDFVTAAGFAQRVLTRAGRAFRSEVPDPLEEREVLRACVAAAPRNSPVAAYAGRFAGGLAQLLATVREVATLGPREADPDPSPRAGEVLRLADCWQGTLGSRGGRTRWIDAAVRGLLEGPAQVPELVLVATDPGPERDLRLLLQLLEDRGTKLAFAPPAALISEPITLHSCPTLHEELRTAARGCMAAAERGIAWHDMVVAAPELAHYSGALRRAFDREGVPFHTPAETPCGQLPRGAQLLHLARLLFGGAPRSSFLAVAGSPLLARPIPPDEIAELEIWSRRDALHGTQADSVELCARWRHDGRVGRHALELVETVLRAARGLVPSADNARRGSVLHQLAGRLLRPAELAEVELTDRLQDCLHALHHADAVCPTPERYVEELEELLRGRGIAMPGRTRGGVQVVRFADAAGFPAQHLHLLGLSRTALRGSPPPTAFLGDRDRETLGLRTADSARLERARLLTELAALAPSLALSYARVDAQGRNQEPLAELGNRALPDETRIPSHPATRARRAVETGRCPRDLGVEHLALSGCRDAAVFGSLLGRDVASMLRRVERLESFDPGQLMRDGDVGPEFGRQILAEPITVTAFELLGRCPHRFLFAHAMHLRPLPEEPDPLRLPRDRIGVLIHGVIERLYREHLEALQSAADPRGLSAEIGQRATELLDAALAADSSLLRREFPGLHALLERRWRAGLLAMLEDDLARMFADGGRPAEIERPVEHTLSVRRPADLHPRSLVLHGKLDRVDQLPGARLRIVDFKTGRHPERLVDGRSVLRGTELQLVLYALLLRAETKRSAHELEVRAVRPRTPGSDPIELRHPLVEAPRYLSGDRAEGVRETLAVLARLLERGLLLPRPDRHCSYCAFRSACRRLHPPSAERVARCDDPEQIECKALAAKALDHPLLDGVAQQLDAGDDDA